MGNLLSRRDWLRVLGASGVAAGLGSTQPNRVAAQGSGFQSSVIAEHEIRADRANPSLVGDQVLPPRQELPVLHKTDVLVVVGGLSTGKHGGWQIPNGVLVPRKIDNVLAAGRSTGSGYHIRRRLLP